jgi:hypothetical protein
MKQQERDTMLEHDGDLSFRDVAPVLETACWAVLALAPVLRAVNGPAVSSDQLAMQIAVVCIAASGAVILRVSSWWRRR